MKTKKTIKEKKYFKIIKKTKIYKIKSANSYKKSAKAVELRKMN